MGVSGNSSPRIISGQVGGVGFFGALPPGGGQPPASPPPPPANDNLAPHHIRVSMANFNEEAEIAVIGHFDTEKARNHPALGYAGGYIAEAQAKGACYYAIGELAWNALEGEGAYIRQQMNDYFIDRVAESQKPVVISRMEGKKDGPSLREEIKRLTEVHGYSQSDNILSPPAKIT